MGQPQLYSILAKLSLFFHPSPLSFFKIGDLIHRRQLTIHFPGFSLCWATKENAQNFHENYVHAIVLRKFQEALKSKFSLKICS